MKIKPTPEQIESEIKKLREMKPTILRKSMFGEDHHAAIDAQIEFLNDELDNTADEFFELPENVQSAVNEAEEWMAGNAPPPSESWKELVKK